MNKTQETGSADRRRKRGTKEKPLIVIVGETASGKSSLAFKIAKEFDGEIIGADSRTIYKGMDIGTAKPNQKEQEQVPHHGLNLVEPGDEYSAADFQKLANKTIAEIRARGRLPIMAGGSGLYVDSVLFEYSFSDTIDKEKRRDLNNMDLKKLQKMAVDINIRPTSDMLKNKRHLISAIERGGVVETKRTKPDNTLTIGLKPQRKSLRYNIERRVETMFKRGLRKEVDELAAKYGWENEAMTGIGYGEFRDWYEGNKSMTQVKKSIVQNTLRLAKKQRTWFKRNRFIEWFEDADEAYGRVKNYLEENSKQKTGN